MKNKIRVLFAVIVMSIILATSACDTGVVPEAGESTPNCEMDDSVTNELVTEEVTEIIISINGTVEETVEVNVEYEDKGVSCPEAYTVITQGKVDTTRLGTYKLTYAVYSDAGEEIKVLHRYVHVADTTPPSYAEQEKLPTLYAGLSYSVEDFLAEYSDNYYNEFVSVEPRSVYFTSPGTHEVQFTLTDSVGNVTVYKKAVEVNLDMLVLLNEVYKDAPHKISTSDTSMGYTHTSVRIDNDTSLGYFGSGSIHFSKKIDTPLGNYASIQISADYGEFSTASVSFHVSNLGGQEYSTGSANINIHDETIRVKKFDWTINKLSLNEQEMLAELNKHIDAVIESLHDYMNNTLHIELK